MCSKATPIVSVVICTLNREKSLRKLIDSLEIQAFKDYEIIICDKEAPLVECKNEGIRKARGEYVLFCDDDVVLNSSYLENAVKFLDLFPNAMGVSGVVYDSSLDRDLFRFPLLKKIYDFFYMGSVIRKPGSVRLEEVDYLEPCCYMVRRRLFDLFGEFDNYEGVAEWSDVDFFYTIRKMGKIYNYPKLYVVHSPFQDRIYNKRLEDIWHRYRNFEKFSKKHLRLSIKLYIYKVILTTYFYLKERKWI